MDQPVTVFVNGEIKFDGLVEADSKFISENFMKNRDRRQLWVNAIDINL